MLFPSIQSDAFLPYRSYLLESLERRTLLSLAINGGALLNSALPDSPQISEKTIQLAKTHYATPTAQLLANAQPDVGTADPTGLTPSQIRGAYGLGDYGSSPITFGGIQGDGTGQTIAIIDAYDDPTALVDLQHFDAQFGLPDPPSFTKVNEHGGATLPGTDPDGPLSVTGHNSWELEESLDIEWSHVIAPQANIVLVECDSASSFDLILTGVATAETLSGVSAISMSFGGPEFAGENGIDPVFNTPVGHNGVSFFASTGDGGSPGGFPAFSQNVLAAGGTSLQVSGNSYVSESGWSSSGGGISNGDETQPSYQSPFFNSSQRTIPDVSMDSNPFTGVPVYDSYDLPTNSWIQLGGTSLATPMWAGLIAVVNQGRVINGLTPLDGPSQTLPLIYGLPSSDFNDIVAGNNGGFSAAIGYDLVTGRGTPIAGLLVPDLATAAAPAAKPDLQPIAPIDIATQTPWSAPLLFSTASGVHTEPAMLAPGSEVFLNGAWFNDGAASTSTTFKTNFLINGSSLGTASTSGLAIGGIDGIEDLDLGSISGSGYLELGMDVDSTNVVGESTETNNNFLRTYMIDANANANYVVQLDPTGTQLQVYLNGALDYVAPQRSLDILSFYLSSTNQTVTIDETNGNPIPVNGFIDDASSSTDKLIVNNGNGNDAITIGSGALTLNGMSVHYAGIGAITVNGGGGNDTLTQTSAPGASLVFNGGTGADTLNVNSGTFTFNADAQTGTQNLTINIVPGASVVMNTSQHIAALNLNGGTASLASGGSIVLVTGALTASGSGTLDLADDSLIVSTMTPNNLRLLLQSGYAGGAWTGWGVRSSVAAAHPGTGIAFGTAASLFPTLPASYAGQTVSSGTTILARYALLSDANQDNTVNLLDLNALATDFGTSGGTTATGDFDYSGTVNIGDFDTLAMEFNTSFPLPGALPSSAAATGSLFSDQNVISDDLDLQSVIS
jgi:CARDB